MQCIRETLNGGDECWRETQTRRANIAKRTQQVVVACSIPVAAAAARRSTLLLPRRRHWQLRHLHAHFGRYARALARNSRTLVACSVILLMLVFVVRLNGWLAIVGWLASKHFELHFQPCRCCCCCSDSNNTHTTSVRHFKISFQNAFDFGIPFLAA